MSARRLSTSVLVLAGAAGLALLSGCTGSRPSTPVAAGAPAATTPAPTGPAGPTSPAPTTPAPVATPSSTVVSGQPTGSGTAGPAPVARPARPDLRSVAGCPGCRLQGGYVRVRPGVSIALVVGRQSGGGFQRAAMVTFRTATGALLDRYVLPSHAGDYYQLDAGPSTLTCDAGHHCLLPAAIGAHSAVMTSAAVRADGSIVPLAQRIGVSFPSIRAVDLDGDGVDEILGVTNDCRPTCANGHLSWIGYHLAGNGYVPIGCAPYRDGDRRPGALVPAACPS